MRQRRLILAAAVTALCHTAARADFVDWYNGAKLGTTLPAHDAQTINPAVQQDVTLTLVDFWATWCEPCRAQIPRLNAWHGKYGALGLGILGVAKEPP